MAQFISIVVPAFNEAENLPLLMHELTEVLKHEDYEIIVVNDGSTDGTNMLLRQMHEQNRSIKFISLSRNFGHQKALRCGLSFAKGDAVIMMDADLQHPPALIPPMLAAWRNGFDLVLTKREEQHELSFFKRNTSKIFYHLLNYLSDMDVASGSADFRLLSKRVVELINHSSESDLFLRGYVEWVGFKKTFLAYEPAQRHAGKSQYTFSKMLALALSGITSFSVKPLRLSALVGGLISLLAFVYALYALGVYTFTDRAITGWTSLLVSMLFLGGLQLLMIGILGEYIGRIFLQAKARPDFIVDEQAL